LQITYEVMVEMIYYSDPKANPGKKISLSLKKNF